MLVQEPATGEQTAEQKCKSLVRQILQLPPDKDRQIVELGRRLASGHVVSGVYRLSDGTKAFVHGPVRDQKDWNVDTAYSVSAKIVRGPRTGELIYAPLFGASGFFTFSRIS
jgi:hypothetical protein